MSKIKPNIETVDKWLARARELIQVAAADGSMNYGVLELLVAVEQLTELVRTTHQQSGETK